MNSEHDSAEQNAFWRTLINKNDLKPADCTPVGPMQKINWLTNKQLFIFLVIDTAQVGYQYRDNNFL